MNISTAPMPFRVAVTVCLSLLLATGLRAAEPAPDVPAVRFETAFLRDMIDHHAMATEMAAICETKATHAELATTCSEMRSMQQAEVELMQGWLQDWYGIEHTPAMTPGAMRQMEKLAALDGAAFEIAFMKTMIRHHAGAIREGAQCLRRGWHDALLDLCAEIIAMQAEEIQTMRDWLCEWYGVCGGRRR
jgi:uncharacterized protein (DUF305 family)